MIIDFGMKDGIYKNYLNGEWVFNSNNSLIEIKSPVDDSLIGKVEAMQPEQIDEAIKFAKQSQKDWANLPMYKRIEILNKVADILDENVESLSKILMMEISKDFKSCISEIKRTADYIRCTCETAKNISGETITGDSFAGVEKTKMALITRVPVGVVLAISPFNYPINLSVSKIAPALVMGNTVVFKPATQGVISALCVVKAFEQAGLPKGVLNTVTGLGRDIGDYTVAHKDIDFINFTGSTAIGRRIAKLVEMKPLLMELGGKDAGIVLEDANLELTSENIVSGAFSYSGQRCTAIKRVLVVNEVADKLIPMLVEKINKLKVGNPDVENVVVTPLIDTKTADFIESLINDAVAKGGKVLTGNKREGNIVYPTLIDNVSLDMDLAWEEPFGPVLPIIRVKDKEEAIQIANDSEYGLQSSVFTENINEAFYIAEKLEVGTVHINNKTERGPDHFPFLGVKSSGIGTQGIKYSIEAMTRIKSTVLNIK